MQTDIFKKVPIEVPNKSGFDEAHSHGFTAKVGTLVPCMTDLLLPNDTISLGVGSEIQLPPMATDFYGRVKAHFEAFFVPCRQLYGGWQELITHPVNGDVYPDGTNKYQKAKYLPTLRIPISEMQAGSLSDYLGYGFSTLGTGAPTIDVKNPLKYLAYHKIWDCFYRDSRLQVSAFGKPAHAEDGSSTGFTTNFGALPYYTGYGDAPYVLTKGSGTSPGLLGCLDDYPCYSLRQRNYGKDYFTNMTPLPQAGQPASVAFGVENNQGAFTIASLRAANALQTWMERNNVAGYRYGDQIRAQFGIYPSDAALDRPIYLGRQIVDVYNKSVFQNTPTDSAAGNNPFSSVGSKYGSPLGVGSGSLVDNFTAKEHGYIMVLFSLVPDSIYSDVLEKDFWYNKMSDFPFPLLAGVGDEAVTADELLGANSVTQTLLDNLHAIVVGYTQRYAYHKFKFDRVSGLLKEGQDLAPFALHRAFSGDSPTIGTRLLEIPTTALDEVAAVTGDVSRYGCWVEAGFEYKKISTLPAYSIPTLGDMKNTHTEVIEAGGTRL